MDDLKQLIFDDVLAHVPSRQLDNFKCNFILNHYSESRLHNINRAEFVSLFRSSLENELRDALIFGKSFLANISLKFGMNLSVDAAHIFPDAKYGEKLIALLREAPVQVLLGSDVTKNIYNLFIGNDHYLRKEIAHIRKAKAISRLCLTAENLQAILDLPSVGYEINLKHSKFSKLFQKLNDYRLTLSREDHLRLFAKPITVPGPDGKPVLNNGPFVLNREFSGDLLRCASGGLTQNQIRSIWLMLDADQRKKYFVEELIFADTIIHLQHGITHAVLINVANEIKHSVNLTPSQNRQIFSNMTLDQLHGHYELSYKKGVVALESSITSASQYLSIFPGNIPLQLLLWHKLLVL
jgi:hypothetical protein